MLRTAFAGRHTADDLSSILNHLLCMERAFLSGDALYNEARVLIDKDAHLDLAFLNESAQYSKSKSTQASLPVPKGEFLGTRGCSLP